MCLCVFSVVFRNYTQSAHSEVSWLLRLETIPTDKMLQGKGFVCSFIFKHITLIEYYFKRKTIIYSFKTRLLSIYKLQFFVHMKKENYILQIAIFNRPYEKCLKISVKICLFKYTKQLCCTEEIFLKSKKYLSQQLNPHQILLKAVVT